MDPMRLFAISDLHLRYEPNRQALQALAPFPDDWLALAGDVGETEEHLAFALSVLTGKFRQVFWVPGNHELWTLPSASPQLRGVARYERLVTICRGYNVRTPEDPYLAWPGAGAPCVIAPTFTLYDYSFRPPDVAPDAALDWAIDAGVICSDEVLLHPDPYATRADWCAARCRYTELRLREVSGHAELVLVNHFPLREDLFALPTMPQFALWCGTRRTADWHVRFPTRAVVYGHLHTPSSCERDGVRFEEVSLGHPCDWDVALGMQARLRTILV